MKLTESEVAAILVQTTNKKYKGFTKKEFGDKNMSHKVQGVVGHSSERVFKSVVCAKMMQSFPITVKYINNAHTKCWTQYFRIQGQKVNDKSRQGGDGLFENTQILLNLQKFITITYDVIRVNKI